MKMAFLSSSSSTPTHLPSLSPSPSKPQLTQNPNLVLSLPLSKPRKTHLSISHNFRAISENGAGGANTIPPATTVPAENVLEVPSKIGDSGPTKLDEDEGSVGPTPVVVVKKFQDPKWVNGTWDLKQFQKDGKTDWDAVIDAEARRRKWLEKHPESTSNDDPVVFDTSIIPWWAWIKRFHLPEAELLNGRAAMIGFFMAYFVDSLTGLGVVDQMNNFICKTLLFVAVLGVLLIRKNEDIENLKKLLEETTFYDKQWQATWQEEPDTTAKD